MRHLYTINHPTDGLLYVLSQVTLTEKEIRDCWDVRSGSIDHRTVTARPNVAPLLVI